MIKEWRSFNGGNWEKNIDVADFIRKNYTPYDGDESFLKGLPKERKKFPIKFRSFLNSKPKKAEF